MKRWGAHRGVLPTLGHLAALEATARLGSFRAAAEEMSLTQGAVAQQVRALERELGRQLFDRLPRGLSPTQEGSEYVNRLRLALGIVEEASRDVMQSGNAADANEITLSTTPTVASRWLIPRLSHLNDTHPEISLMIDAAAVVRPLASEGGVDMAIRWGAPPFPEGHTHFLLPGGAIPVCSPSLLGGKRRLQPDELFELPLISDSHHNWKLWCEVYGNPRAKIGGPVFSQMSHALEAAEEGLGVALVPRPLVEKSLKSGALVQALGEEYQLDTRKAFYIIAATPICSESAAGKVVEWLLREAKSHN